MKNEKKKYFLMKKPSRRKYLFAAVLVAFLIFAIFIYDMLSNVSKSDPASEEEIRKIIASQFGKEPDELTHEDFVRVTYLNISYIKLYDIKLLEKLINLKELHLYSLIFYKSKIPKWMTMLDRLRIYNLNEKLKIDLSPLEKLSNLEKLDIRSINVSDLKPIKDLSNLKYLSLSSLNISNLEPIKSLKYLEELYIIDCVNITEQHIEDLQKTLPELEIRRYRLPVE